MKTRLFSLSAKKIAQLTGISIVCLLIMLQLSPVQSNVKTVLERVDGLFYDARLKLSLSYRPQFQDTNIVIVDLDEKSLKEQGRWPWSRKKTALLLDHLFEYGAVIVAFDVIFSEAQRNPVDELADLIQDSPELSQSLAKYRQQADADSHFAASLNQGDVVLGVLFERNENVSRGFPAASRIKLNRTVDNSKVKALPYNGYIGNINLLQDNAMGEGFINSSPDRDGFIRRAALLTQYQGQLYPSLALETARLYALAEQIEVNILPYQGWYNIQSINIHGTAIDTDENGRVIVPYRGGQKSFPYISATDVLTRQVDKNLLTDAIVFVGTSAVGLADLRSTPVGIQYPGVEIHANVLEGLLHPEIFAYQPDIADWLIVAYLIFFGLILAIKLPVYGPKKMALWGVLLLVTTLMVNFYLWNQLKTALPLTTPILLCLLVTSLNLIIGFFTENSQKRMIKSMFDQYVPPAHIDKMLADPKAVSLAGERKELTVLFSDIRNFTQLSEGLTANELKQLLNQYFSPVTKVILDHHGTIDKYVGDMVMAFWGAPIEDNFHAKNAIASALAMQVMTRKLSSDFEKQGLPAIAIGIGINTGEMNVGDMGSEFRRAYTVLGDAVNLGSRLESLTKYYGCQILVAESSYQQTKDDFEFQFVDLVQVKGKSEAIKIYQPLALKTQITSKLKSELADYQQAYDFYITQNWPQAEKAFTDLMKQNPEQVLYSIYNQRIAQLKGTSLPAAWDGVFKHINK